MTSELIDNNPSGTTEPEEFMNSSEYQEFVAQVSKHCRCANGPCDGVLAGGMCDEIGEDDEPEWDAYDWWSEDDDG